MAKIAELKNARLKQYQNAPGKSISVDIEHHGQDNAEFYQLPGFHGRPQDGHRGVIVDCAGNSIVIASYDYEFNETIQKGETLIFSYNSSGVLQGKILVKADGNIVINDGTKSAVSYAELNTALQLMVTAFNTALGTKLDGPGTAGTVVLNMSAAEVSEVKLP